MNANISISQHKFPPVVFPSFKLAVLALLGLVLIVGAVLVLAPSLNREPGQSASNIVVIAVPVPTPPAESAQPSPSETPAPLASPVEPSAVAVPVPTPPAP